MLSVIEDTLMRVKLRQMDLFLSLQDAWPLTQIASSVLKNEIERKKMLVSSRYLTNIMVRL